MARLAGVSRTTASFVVNGRNDMRISEDARLRVLDAADRLSYRPNAVAKALRTSTTRTIAFVSDSVSSDQYAGQLARGALSAALASGHLMLIAETGGEPGAEHDLLHELIDRRVDGFVYASHFTRTVALPDELHGHPVVLLNCVAERPLTTVLPDELASGRIAAGALLEAGHGPSIVVVGEPAPHVFAGRERLGGIEVTLAAHGHEVAEVLACPWWPSDAFEAVRSFLLAGGRCSAFLCMNDRVALGTYQAVAGHGLRVPDDVSVVSFDDSDLAEWLTPRLTSVALPYRAMGVAAVELLLRAPAQPTEHRVDMPLSRRDSLAPPGSWSMRRGVQ